VAGTRPLAEASPFQDTPTGLDLGIFTDAFESEPPTDTFESYSPKTAAGPASNAVDEDAAEPRFVGKVRSPRTPLLDVSTVKESSRWNVDTHPATSGITLGELAARLEKYIDRRGLDALVHRANAAAPGSYGSDQATVVTLLAHQFQLKTCRVPTVGTTLKECTMNGRVAEDTLDALGFVYHAGESLNTADRANRIAAATLARVPKTSLMAQEPGLTAKTWWSYMVSPPWLGLPIKHGIHLLLLRKLRRAQRVLMDLPAYAGLSPAELGRTLGLEEELKGARPSETDWGMHLFGLAIDIGYTRNPWVSNPKRETAKLADITLRAARLTGWSGAGDKGLSARLLHGLAVTHVDTAKVYAILAGWNRALGDYFRLAGDAKRLEGLLPIANAMFPRGDWFKPGESLAAAAVRWSRRVQADFDEFATAVGRRGKKDEVRHGFMDLARDLVIALRNDACLGWGAVDLGPRASGDIMHFDCRVEGIGRTIAITGRKPFVPTAGHLCLGAAAAPTVEREIENLADTDRPIVPVRPASTLQPVPGGYWLSFVSGAIPPYKGGAGKPQPTGSSVYVPTTAWKAKAIDLLVFFHGDPGPCAKTFDPDPKNVSRKFRLDAQIRSTTRRIAVAVPVIHWIPGKSGNMLGKWTAANLNTYVGEALDAIGAESGVRPDLGRLIVAGHSHAYALLSPLACEFNHDAPATKTGAVAKLDQVWALDSTYGLAHVRALEAWANKHAAGRFIAVLWKKGPPMSHWKNYYAATANPYCPSGLKPPANLKMCAVDATHCEIPGKYVGPLLALPRNAPNWCAPLE
jgi:hypothetical protein